MNIQEIEKILATCLCKEIEEYEYPTEENWKQLEIMLNCKFCDEFKIFINLMSKYSFPGDMYNVTNKHNNGNDTILCVYEHESKYSEWNKNMIPFYGIGNGDYFCINKENAAVYYYYSDKLEFEFYIASFGDWIIDLPDFLE